MNIANNPLNPPFLASKVYAPSQLDYFEQIQVITTHPFFTGQCPQCKQKLSLVSRTPGNCSCLACGWSDREDSPA
ncbi:hypothetical protein [Altericista sp. CCNU0014]|uniref:hypothetical protein n=1 Tax=Altericista sp. CCNU0014 TaxID=3082949 RepID=UPI0038508E66